MIVKREIRRKAQLPQTREELVDIISSSLSSGFRYAKPGCYDLVRVYGEVEGGCGSSANKIVDKFHSKPVHVYDDVSREDLIDLVLGVIESVCSKFDPKMDYKDEIADSHVGKWLDQMCKGGDDE